MKAVEMMEAIEKQKRQLEMDIYSMLSTRLQQFHEETGLSPDSISLNMLEQIVIGERRNRYHLSDVRVSLGL